jgi:hypothetical protein
MLTDQAKQVQEDVEALKTARRNRKQEDRFRSRREKLRGLVQDVLPPVRTLRVLHENGINVEYEDENLDQTTQRIETIRRKFQEEPSWIIRSENDLSDLDKWIRRHRDKIQRRVQSAWRDYYQDQVPDLSEDLLRVLEQFDDFRQAVKTIRERGGQLKNWKEDPPQTDDALSAFQKMAQQRRATWEQLRSDEMSEDVLDFLVDAGTKGASVDQLTDEVRTWLEKNGLLDRVQITLSK